MQYSTDPLDGETAPAKLPEMSSQALSEPDILYFIIEGQAAQTGSTSDTTETPRSSSEYQQFLASKRTIVPTSGIEVALDAIHPMLFPFQKDIVRWALDMGRKAVGIELKESYFRVACKNLSEMEQSKSQTTLWNEIEVEAAV